MNEGQKSVLIWTAIILFVCYLIGANPVKIIGSAFSSAQTIHNSNATHP